MGMNFRGNFHDSKSTLWCHIHDRIMSLPDGCALVCDSAFVTLRKLKGKIVELKEITLEHVKERTDKEKALNHIQQCDEWGNNVLIGEFSRLRVKILTNNLK